MTDGRKALVRATDETAIVPDVNNLRALAKDLLASGMFPAVKTPAGALTVIQAGMELGIPPVAALNTMAIIKGRLGMEAKAYLALAHARGGVTWTIDKEGPEGCWMTFKRKGFDDVKVSFTREEAEKANLLKKDNWLLYEKDMFFARAAGRGSRRIAPDAVLGLYIREELMDVEDLSTLPGEIPASVQEAIDRPQSEMTVKDEFNSDPKDLTDPETNVFSGEKEPENKKTSKLQLFELYGKQKAALAQLKISEKKMWEGITGFSIKEFGREVIDLDGFDDAELALVVDYLQRWEAKILEMKKKKADGSK